jgi:hypothetical protein
MVGIGRDNQPRAITWCFAQHLPNDLSGMQPRKSQTKYGACRQAVLAE